MARAKKVSIKKPKMLKPKMPKIQKFKHARIKIGTLKSFKNNASLTRIY